MILTQTAAPAETPLDLATLKEHLRVSHTAQDDYLTALIAAVTSELDGPGKWLRRVIVTQSWQMEQRHFPLNTAAPWRMPLPPLQTVDSVEYYDDDDTLQVASTDLYTVHTPEGQAGYIVLGNEQQWPNPGDRVDAVRVTFTAGYGAAADCPAQLLHGIKLLCASLYTNRGDQQTSRGVDEALRQRMLGPYRWVEMS